MSGKGGRRSTTFKKGDPRAKEAARKAVAARMHPPKISEARALLGELQQRAPQALEGLDTLLAEKDDFALKFILDRLLPAATTARLIDEGIAQELDALREENAALRAYIAELEGTPVRVVNAGGA